VYALSARCRGVFPDAATAACYSWKPLYKAIIVPLIVVAALVLVLTTIAAVVGVHVGRKLQTRLSDAERFQLFGVQASLLGLLALLLGFSFAMGQTRYDARRTLVVAEANAIGTSRLRAAAVPDPTGSEIEALLKAYVDSRLTIVRSRTEASAQAAIADSERLQLEVWSRAANLAKSEPRSVPAGLLLQSLNEMIDLHASRLGAAQNHIPPTVLIALILVAVAAMGWVGAGFGCVGRRGTVTTLILSTLIAFVITMIVDLDRPRSGLIRVKQTALLDLQRAIQ
jgi:hypothetical protein